MKTISLQEYVAFVPSKKKLNYKVEINGTADETKLLKTLCSIKLSKRRRFIAWSWLLHDIYESLYKLSPTDIFAYFTEETLNYLIDNEIDLISLGHFPLPNEWLQKIYEKNNNCIEALKTINLRNKE